MASDGFTEQELKEFRDHFDALDVDGNKTIDRAELTTVLKALNLYKNDEQVAALIEEVDTNKSGTVDWDEFLVILAKERAGGASKESSGFLNVVHESKRLIQVKGASGLHSFAQEELSAFAIHISNCLAGDEDLAHLLPIQPDGLELCEKVYDGMLLCKFINCAVPSTIDERVINKRKAGKDLSLFQRNENLTLAISSATSIGVTTVNLGADELAHGTSHPHLVLGVIWQLVKLQLLNSINLKNHPELVRLLEDGEELADLLRLPPDQLLLRWFNYHLRAAGHPKRVTNFSGDVKDSEAYTVLLHQIAPNTCDTSALQLPAGEKRAERVLQNADKLNVQCFIKPKDIASGNSRLNLAFTAAIFNQCPGLDPLNEEEMDKAGLMDDDTGDSREERAFRMWINSMGIADLYINNLFEDCRDGLALLKVMDRVQPGIVDWAKVERKVNNKFKRVHNCNYVVVLGKEMRFSLVGIGGVDIVDGNKKLVLALVWQLMRFHTIRFLKEVQAKRFGGAEVTDDMIVKWANETVAAAGREGKMASFRDPSLATSHFFLDLLFAVENRVIDWDLVTEGANEDDRLLNARYALSVARKLGCTIFLLPEDIVEVNPKMIMTFVASIMAVAK